MQDTHQPGDKAGFSLNWREKDTQNRRGLVRLVIQDQVIQLIVHQLSHRVFAPQSQHVQNRSVENFVFTFDPQQLEGHTVNGHQVAPAIGRQDPI